MTIQYYIDYDKCLSPKINDLVMGTYIHPHLVPNFMAWVSPSFNYFIIKLINEYTKKKPNNIELIINKCLKNDYD